MIIIIIRSRSTLMILTNKIRKTSSLRERKMAKKYTERQILARTSYVVKSPFCLSQSKVYLIM